MRSLMNKFSLSTLHHRSIEQLLEVAPNGDLVSDRRPVPEHVVIDGDDEPLLRRGGGQRGRREHDEHPGRAGQHPGGRHGRAAARGRRRAAQLHDPRRVPLHHGAGPRRVRGGRRGRVRRRGRGAGGGVQEGQRGQGVDQREREECCMDRSSVPVHVYLLV